MSSVNTSKHISFPCDNLFGLIGKTLDHSFSKIYFTQKFKELGLSSHVYELFPLADISKFPHLLKENSNLKGLNVTIPYKKEIIPFLDKIDPAAQQIGAVNTIAFDSETLYGYNTDAKGFEASLQFLYPDFKKLPSSAFILGTGGAAQAVAYVLTTYGIPFHYVSRNPKGEEEIGYLDLNDENFHPDALLVNATPLGTLPNNDTFPLIPYDLIGPHNKLIDLVYNPRETVFLKKAKEKGAKVDNGLRMLYAQAEEAWRIWQSFR